VRRSNALVSVLYDLARDDLPAGRLEQVVRDAEKAARYDETRYSNPYLVDYAESLAERLRAREAPTIDPTEHAAVSRYDSLVGTLAATVVQWRELAVLGRDNKIAAAALERAADALADIVGNYQKE
jgi:hypothetical protein